MSGDLSLTKRDMKMFLFGLMFSAFVHEPVTVMVGL